MLLLRRAKPWRAKNEIAFVGDSMVTNPGSGQSIVDHLRRSTGRNVIQGGVGGEVIASTLSRVQAAPQYRTYTTPIWAGGNNYLVYPAGTEFIPTCITDIKAGIASIITYLAHTRYLVVGNVAGNAGGLHPTAVQVREAKRDLNLQLAALYGTRFIDAAAILQAYDPSDTDAAANLWMPSILAQDSSHPNALGVKLIAQVVRARIRAFGW